jgi:16S rRNA (guanine966-N2)-methyltransferase
MRIIAGTYKGRTISVPDGIRPTRDNVKESVFNILSARIDGAHVLDLFSGSGALGLEALSRFAQEVVFVDNSGACTDIIESNISRLSPDSGSVSVRVITKDAYASIRLLYSEGKKFDIIFIDPPYYKNTKYSLRSRDKTPDQFNKNRIRKCLKYINVYDILCHSGLAIVEHFKKDIVPAESESLVLSRQLNYGDTVISIYKHKEKHD